MSQATVKYDRLQPDKYQTILERTINEILTRGNTNNTGIMTLTSSTTTTRIVDSRISNSQLIMFMPQTASAATELYSGVMYVSEQKNGEFTITHANTGQTDRTFGYVFFG